MAGNNDTDGTPVQGTEVTSQLEKGSNDFNDTASFVSPFFGSIYSIGGKLYHATPSVVGGPITSIVFLGYDGKIYGNGDEGQNGTVDSPGNFTWIGADGKPLAVRTPDITQNGAGPKKQIVKSKAKNFIQSLGL